MDDGYMVEVYDPRAGKFFPTGRPGGGLPSQAVLLDDGRVLIATSWNLDGTCLQLYWP